MEAWIALATLHRRWRAVARGKAETQAQITIEVKGGMPIKLELCR